MFLGYLMQTSDELIDKGEGHLGSMVSAADEARQYL
jgi:hypothetical protein